MRNSRIISWFRTQLFYMYSYKVITENTNGPIQMLYTNNRNKKYYTKYSEKKNEINSENYFKYKQLTSSK